MENSFFKWKPLSRAFSWNIVIHQSKFERVAYPVYESRVIAYDNIGLENNMWAIVKFNEIKRKFELGLRCIKKSYLLNILRKYSAIFIEKKVLITFRAIQCHINQLTW